MLDHYGLTVITWRVMAVIAHFGPLSAKEVAMHTSTDAFFVSRAIDQLVKQDAVRRDTDPLDRRKLVLQLTAKGLRTHEKIEAAVNAIEERVLERMSSKERETVNKALSLLMEKSLVLQGGQTSWQDFL
jgi:DNA-binding MarR family transcriptional regulator